MSLSLKPTIENWNYRMREEIEILNAFVVGLEKQIEDEKENFNETVEVIVEDEDYGIPDFETTIRVKNGLDDMSWNLESVFLSHFPNVHRQSNLITLYSFFEDGLYDLCKRFKDEIDTQLNLSDLSGKGIQKYRTYLVKVVGLDFEGVNSGWEKIKNIQKIRNVVVHSRGLVKDNDKEVIASIQQTSNIELTNGEVVLINGALHKILEVFKEFFASVDKAITKFKEDRIVIKKNGSDGRSRTDTPEGIGF